VLLAAGRDDHRTVLRHDLRTGAETVIAEDVVVLDPAFGKDMEAAFNEDLRDSKEVTLEQWRDRPWADRIKEWAARLTEYWI